MIAAQATTDPFAPVTGKPPVHGNGHDGSWRPIVPVPNDAPRTLPQHPLGKSTGQWPYHDLEGNLAMVVRRFDTGDGRKEFRPFTFCEGASGQREWRAQALGAPRPLYGLNHLTSRPRAPVLVVEGEKTADAARALFADHVCVTSPGGAAGARQADWAPLAKRRVVIWPDNDEPGRQYAKEAAALIEGAGAASVRILDIPSEWPKSWDLADDFPAGVSRAFCTDLLRDTAADEADDLIDLSPLRDGRSEPPSLPIDLFGLWADWIDRSAEAANAPTGYVAAALLAATGGLLGNARWAQAWEGWSEPPALWIGAVGDPSMGKSPAADLVLDALRKIEREELAAFEPERLRHEAKRELAVAALAQWKEEIHASAKQYKPAPPKPDNAAQLDELLPPRVVLQDVTPEASAAVLAANPRGIFTTRDELSGWLGGMDRYNAGAERSYWIEAYGGRPYRVDRKGGKSFSIPRLTISVFGGMQPDKFTSLVAETDDDGLAARFLWVWPQARKFARPKRSHDPHRVCDAFRRLRSLPMLRDEDGGERPFFVRCTDEAAGVLEEWWREQEGAMLYGGSLMRSWRGKGRGHALRLSLILEYLEWAYEGEGTLPSAITGASMMRAVALYSEYLLPMAQRVFGDAALPESERDAGAVAQYIVATRPKSIHVRNDIYRKRVGGISDAPRAQRAIDGLVEAGWLFDAASREGQTTGRRKNVYSVNPALWDAIKGARHG